MKDLLQLLFDFWFVGASLAAIVLIAYFSSKRKSNIARVRGNNNRINQSSK